MGYPLVGYRIYLLDEYHQPVVPGQPGEIVIGGVGVFAGYYGRADLTEKVLIKIDNEQCYATGDLARMDVTSGELIFIGRRDHQIKLRGQRIELSGIESVIIKSSSNIVNCIVMKESSDGEDYLIAYVQVNKNDKNSQIRDEIFSSCSSQLPTYMVPTKWLFLLELPLNDNGKVDRKRLYLTMETVDQPSLSPRKKVLSSLELKLQDIFMRAFRLTSPPDVQVPFGLLGGTSLGAMRALNLIRQEVTEKMDIGILFRDPSVQRLAATLEPMLSATEPDKEKDEKDNDDFSVRPASSLLIESLGIVLLAWQWLWPIFMVANNQLGFLPMLLVPFIHLLQYPLFLELLGGPFSRGRDTLYSWRYYRIWFLRRLWSLNTYWLRYLLGTPFYNAYLRLCGACIHDGVHIYTTDIDAPWLLKVGNSTYIGEEVVLSSLTYHDRIYELHEIFIGSHCSIGTRCVLHDRVDIQDGVLLEPSTVVTGRISGKHEEAASQCKLNWTQSFFQFIAIFMMISIHVLILKLSWYPMSWLPMCISLSLGWLMWIIFGSIFALLLLSCVDHVQQNFSHPLNSWKFVYRFWLRQLIVNSFGFCLSSLLNETSWYITLILSWLGATIERNDVLIEEFVPLLSVPSNLLIIEEGITITSSVRFCPYEVTTCGQCVVVGLIRIGRRSFIGNRSLLRSGACVQEDVLVGCFTRVDSTTSTAKKGK